MSFIPQRMFIPQSLSASAISGSGNGATNRVALWSNGTTLTSSSNLSFDPSSQVLSIGGTITSLMPSAGTVEWIFGKDVNAGDTTNIAQFALGNSGSNQGRLRISYNNAAASGSPAAQWAFDPRNNADSSNFNCARILMEKSAGADSGTVYIQASSAGTLDSKLTIAPTTIEFKNNGDISGGISASNEWTIGVSGTSAIHKIHSAVGTPAAQVMTMTNGPAGSSGNPAVFLKLAINGATYIVPLWNFS